jgi:hypothetical protein
METFLIVLSGVGVLGCGVAFLFIGVAILNLEPPAGPGPWCNR